MTTVLVSGAGGFVGSHLVRYLKARGYHVIGADVKYPEFSATAADAFYLLDLRNLSACLRACRGVDEVYHLAADMGGMGYLHEHQADVLHDNALMNLHMLEAARVSGVKRFLFTSSACVYPEYRQMDAEVTALKESDAWPAQPDLAYGMEKLFMEEACRHYRRQYGFETRIGRLHNVYGPEGTWRGGREKAPAALSRKIALASDGDTIEIWGDGEQTRSFCYIDDCVEGLYRLMRSDYPDPLNIGSDELTTINNLVRLIAEWAKVKIEIRHDLSKPQGVRGRNSDNTLCRDVLGWEPQTTLVQGIPPTYDWIEAQVLAARKVAA